VIPDIFLAFCTKVLRFGRSGRFPSNSVLTERLMNQADKANSLAVGLPQGANEIVRGARYRGLRIDGCRCSAC
jgi:hypothetical protein